MVNKVILIGNVGQDPEVRVFDGGKKLARFSFATSENWKDKNGKWQTETQWHKIQGWRNVADQIEARIKKGMSLYIEGKLKYEKWTDKENNDRTQTLIVASFIRITSKVEQPEPSRLAPTTQPTSNTSGDDDLPF